MLIFADRKPTHLSVLVDSDNGNENGNENIKKKMMIRAAKPAISGHTAFFLEILANFYDIRSPLKFQSNPAWP